jgi:hypothetical protein
MDWEGIQVVTVGVEVVVWRVVTGTTKWSRQRCGTTRFSNKMHNQSIFQLPGAHLGCRTSSPHQASNDAPLSAEHRAFDAIPPVSAPGGSVVGAASGGATGDRSRLPLERFKASVALREEPQLQRKRIVTVGGVQYELGKALGRGSQVCVQVCFCAYLSFTFTHAYTLRSEKLLLGDA